MTVAKPNITWRGSPNYWPGRIDDKGRTFAPIAIICHIMVGTMESTDGWFKNPASEASTTFGVAKDGRIWQWVKESDTHWGNGLLQSPDMSVGWIAECANQGINPNFRTLAIEHEGWPGDVFPETQYQATLALHRWLIATYKIPADRQHINGHFQLMKYDKADCPGSSFPWTRLMGDLTVFNPNPNNYSIGGGMLIELNNRHLTAATPENYLTVQPGQLPQSELFTVEGPILKGIKKPDNSGQWFIKVVNTI